MSDVQPPTFEAALGELERILRALEDGSTTLDEGLSQYERGVGLLKQCYGQLRDAEQRISVVAGLDAEGKPVVKPFDHIASEPAPTEPKRRTTTASAPRSKPNDSSGMY